MGKNISSKLIIFTLGFIAGTGLTLTGGVYIYKHFKDEIKSVFHFERKTDTESEQGNAPVSQVKEKPEESFEGYKIFVASSLDRIFKSGKTLSPPQFSESANLSAAQNEYESFQVAIKNGNQETRVNDIVFTDLQHESSQYMISKQNISVRTVGYIPTKKPYYPVKFVGLWPDPLMPFKADVIPPSTTQPFWMTIYIPTDIPPGNYNGTVLIKINEEEPIQIPLHVKVHSFSLPIGHSLKTAFDFYGHETPKRYPKYGGESVEDYNSRIAKINDEFILEMLKNKMDPVLNVNPADEEEMARLQRYFAHGLSNFSVGKRGGTLNNNWPENDLELEGLIGEYRLYGELLALNNMLNYHYIYTWDESHMGEPVVSKVTSMIHRAYPKLKNLVCYHGIWNPDKNPEWGKDIDIWVVQISDFNEKAAKRLEDMGIEMWMYISGPSSDGAPNLAMDFDSIDYRIVPWMCFRYGWKGFLYWCVNWWALVDPFETAANTKWEQNGNGLLYYPGEDGPIASLRAEIWRDGMEDYEYIVILKNMLQQLEQKNLTSTHAAHYQEAQALLDFKKDIVPSNQKFTKDPQILLKRRQDIAEKIEQLKLILSQG